MAKTDIFVPIYLAPFLQDTTDLDEDESGWYLYVLVHSWNNGGTMTIERLSKIIKKTEKKTRKKLKKIEKFFQCMGGEFWQKKLLLLKMAAEDNRALFSEYGKMGGRPKKN